jgi:hypothetical protein
VFATNDKRPDFLRDHPPVKAPTIEMIDHPNNPYVKLLVVFGRDDKDLLLAAKGIAQGNILFRGSSVTVDDVKPCRRVNLTMRRTGCVPTVGHLWRAENLCNSCSPAAWCRIPSTWR